MTTSASLSAIIDAAVADGAFPAAQACVIVDGDLFHASSHGSDHRGRPVSPDTIFDVASVTKAVATTAVAAVLIGQNTLALDDDVARYIPRFSGSSRESVTVRKLLAHGSGLPAWEPFFKLAMADPLAGELFGEQPGSSAAFARARELVIDATLAAPITESEGRRVYSDLGFIILGLLLEAAGSAPLHRLCADAVHAPLGLADTGFVDLRHPEQTTLDCEQRHLMPTGLTRPREPAVGQENLYEVPPQEQLVRTGEVDDDNAFAMGGIAGHAGLFSTARDIARFGRLVLEEIDGARRLGPGVGETLTHFATPDPTTEGATRGLGFDMPAPTGSLAGDLMGKSGPRGAIGHLGFTGTSLWVDLDRRLSVALLTNRTFPTRANVDGIRSFRPAFHDAVIREVEAAAS